MISVRPPVGAVLRLLPLTDCLNASMPPTGSSGCQNCDSSTECCNDDDDDCCGRVRVRARGQRAKITTSLSLSLSLSLPPRQNGSFFVCARASTRVHARTHALTQAHTHTHARARAFSPRFHCCVFSRWLLISLVLIGLGKKRARQRASRRCEGRARARARAQAKRVVRERERQPERERTQLRQQARQGQLGGEGERRVGVESKLRPLPVASPLPGPLYNERIILCLSLSENARAPLSTHAKLPRVCVTRSSNSSLDELEQQMLSTSSKRGRKKVCVCVCVYKREKARTQARTHTHTHTHTHEKCMHDDEAAFERRERAGGLCKHFYGFCVRG